MKKNLAFVCLLTLLLALVVSGCATPATEAPVVTQAAPAVPEAVTEAVAPTQAPTMAPTEVPTEAPTVAPTAAAAGELILATTTSTEDSGLLQYLLPDFEQEFGVKINVIAVGTGQALTLGQDGNADVLLVHARAKEDEFMAAGHGVRREDVMYNDFVILGPAADPAGIQGMTDAAAALAKIAAAEAPFISRGDESGTHTKEKSLWSAAKIEPAGDWYISAGQGMGEVLTMANEQAAYTLSDRATYLARSKTGLDLAVMVEGDTRLLNPYGVIAVNPEKGAQIKNELANQFIDWIVSLPVQEKIAAFGMDEFGESLFIPDAASWRAAHATADTTAEPQGEVALKVTGLVDNEQAWSEAEVKALETMSAEYTNKDGVKTSYTGVSINALLALAGVKPEAKTVVFVADDGFSAEIALADLQACPDCIVAFRDQGGFSTVLPGQPGSLQVKGVVEIQLK